VSSLAHATKRRPRWEAVNLIDKTMSKVDLYLTQTLEVPDLSEFNLSRKLLRDVRRGLSPEKTPDVNSKIGASSLDHLEVKVMLDRFSNHSYPTIDKVLRALGRSNYNNAILLGPAGVGKTFTIEQLVALLSFGVAPEELSSLLGLDDVDDSPFIKQFVESYVGNVQVYKVNDSLLTYDNTPPQKAFAKADMRMKKILNDIFIAAEEDFQKSGRRTIFVFEEVATLPELVQSTLKSLLDKTGFKDPSNLLSKGSEIGVSVISNTTPDEYRKMVRGDSAIERRYEPVFLLEPDETEAVRILQKARPAYELRFNLGIPDEILEYLVVMRKFFNNPPQAMPASILNAMNDIYIWASNAKNRPDPNQKEITLDDAYHFMVEKAGLPKEVWIPKASKAGQPGLEWLPPLFGLEDKVRKHLVGSEIVDKNGIIDRMVRRLKTGRSTGFRETPVYFVMGPPGSGKDTIAKAINQEMFGHDGRHLMFSVAGNQGAQFSAIFEGAPRGSSSDSESPLLLQALESGPHHGVIVLNEAKDLPSEEFDRLKTIVETGEIRPKGLDSRMRPLGLNPIFIMGQWGEELFEGKSDDEVRKIYESLTEKQLIDILIAGKEKGKFGAVPASLVQRALRTGGIFLLPPVPKDRYVEIVRKDLISIKENLLQKSRISLEISSDIEDFIVRLALATGRGTRGLLGLSSDLTETLVSEAGDKGFPIRSAKFKLSMSEAHGEDISQAKLKIEWLDAKTPKEALLFPIHDLLRSSFEAECQGQLF
jgi:DNA polymerase III delta prime subunit